MSTLDFQKVLSNPDSDTTVDFSGFPTEGVAPLVTSFSPLVVFETYDYQKVLSVQDPNYDIQKQLVLPESSITQINETGLSSVQVNETSIAPDQINETGGA